MVRLIITGGTFDKQYDAIRGELTFQKTHMPEILDTVRCTVPVELELNQLIDSLEMGESDRERIVAACCAAPENRIVITHGTDTMTVTAERLAAEMTGAAVAGGIAGREGAAKQGAGGGGTDAGPLSGKTIVLTGAMVPFTVAGSDALFNLGGALVAVQTLPPGVYIVMHGRTFSAGEVKKDRIAGRFQDST
ncbi:MAG: asparaginase domain-containing protein [Alkalispirochaeta sp.]